MADDQALDLFNGETFVYELKEEFLNRLVNVEFCCCAHVKKAVGGVLVEVGKDFIELVAFEETMEVLLFGESGVIETENVGRVVIPIERICSVEDPCKKKKHDPCHDDATAE